jgi:hypothetical protein
LDSRLAALLSKSGKQVPVVPPTNGNGHAPGSPHSAPGMNNVVAAPAGAAAVLPPVLQPVQPPSPVAAVAPAPVPAPVAAPVAAVAPAVAAAAFDAAVVPVPAAAVGGAGRVTHQPPPEVQVAAAVCKEDPGAADACKVVTKFIQGGFWGKTAA